jgi:flagellar biosynthesis/type III secretory pathway chaperone
MEPLVMNMIEKLFYKKIMLYNDLLHCFEAERKALIEININRLWELSKEKDEICEQITSIRKEMMAAVHPADDQEPFRLNRIMDAIPKKQKDKFEKLYLRILKLKGEIEILRKQNLLYIDDSLTFMDEIISILTGKTESDFVYNDRCHFKSSGPYLFLNREV